MAGKVQIILGQIGTTNYQPQVYFIPDPIDDYQPPTEFVSWCWISADEVLNPGEYTIPEDQRGNLDWWTGNNFRLDNFGKRHVNRMMVNNEPATVIVL